MATGARLAVMPAARLNPRNQMAKAGFIPVGNALQGDYNPPRPKPEPSANKPRDEGKTVASRRLT